MSISFPVDDSPRKKIWYACGMCRWGNAGIPDPDCFHCHGTDVVTFERDEWSVNFSNSNAKVLMTRIGLGPDPDYCGYIEPEDVFACIVDGEISLRIDPSNERLKDLVKILKIACAKGKG